MYKICIFDLDGTLTDTVSSIRYFGNRALDMYGLKGFSNDEYKIMVGNGAKILVKRMLENNNCFDEEIYQKVLNEYNSSYDNDFTYLTTVYDGIYDLISFLKENNFKLGVVSNKPHSTTVQIVNHFFPENTFDVVYGQREGFPIKPDPKVVLSILDTFGLSSDDLIYVGDTKTDMETGKNAKAFTVGVLWGFRDETELKSNGADLIISSPYELTEFIKKL